MAQLGQHPQARPAHPATPLLIHSLPQTLTDSHPLAPPHSLSSSSPDPIGIGPDADAAPPALPCAPCRLDRVGHLNRTPCASYPPSPAPVDGPPSPLDAVPPPPHRTAASPSSSSSPPRHTTSRTLPGARTAAVGPRPELHRPRLVVLAGSPSSDFLELRRARCPDLTPPQ